MIAFGTATAPTRLREAGPPSLCVVISVTIALLGSLALTPADEETDRREELKRLNDEIAKLETELRELGGRERGLLGELARLDADLELRETELEEVTLRLEEVNAAIRRHDEALSDLDRAQEERKRYLAFRLREIYKGGAEQPIQRLLEGEEVETYWRGLRYASYLSERDAEVLRDYRSDAERSALEREELEAARARLAPVQEEMQQARDRVAASRRQRSAMLRRLREDRTHRQAALEELRQAAEELTRLVESLSTGKVEATLDIRKFKGLLEWPTEGQVGAGFGTITHPRFGTQVPHPGWDLEAPFGASIVAVFDGTVVFSDWMRGYGLTTIVDHGRGVLSIYAHASVLMAQRGESVVRGQTLGKVGETGSLRGPYLYFELRVDGKPVDPGSWLRGR